MKKYIYTPLALTDKAAFSEASREELRVLLALIEADGLFENTDELARLSKTSKARTSSSLVYWEEAGVISEGNASPTITEEFEEKLSKGQISEYSAKETAKSIRDEKLGDMLNECAALMNRAALNSTEVKQITALHEQYGLSDEFIVTLAAHLAESSSLTVTKLVNKAINLSEREIDTMSALENYIADRENENQAEYEFRRIFGIYDRALSKTEKECFRKWSKEYGYFTEIVGEAYDIAVNNVTRGHVSYANKLLAHWYESGCRTLTECRQRYERDAEEKKTKKSETKKPAAKKEPKRYADFDADEVFLRALERSYGKQDKEEGK